LSLQNKASPHRGDQQNKAKNYTEYIHSSAGDSNTGREFAIVIRNQKKKKAQRVSKDSGNMSKTLNHHKGYL
jgi:hypothetical protein